LPKIYLKKVTKDINEFYSDIIFYRIFCAKINSAKKIIKTEREKNEVIENVLIKVCAKWEKLIDEILIYKFSKDTSKFCESVGVRIKKAITRDLSLSIVIGNRFFDFKDIGDLIKKAGHYLTTTNNIFKNITATEKNKIEEIYFIRNYLSHYSHKSKKSLWSMYKKTYKMKRFKEPGDFLRKETNRNPKITRLDQYLNIFSSALGRLQASL